MKLTEPRRQQVVVVYIIEAHLGFSRGGSGDTN